MRYPIAVLFTASIAMGVLAQSAQAKEPHILIKNVTYTSIDQGVPPNGITCPSKPLVKLFAAKCDSKQTCGHATIHPTTLCPDPGGGTKRLRVFYTCEWPKDAKIKPVKKEADGLDGQGLTLNCEGVLPLPDGTGLIKILSATYGVGNGPHCSAENFTKSLCDGTQKCSYRIGAELCPGDPIVGTSKTSEVKYECRYVSSKSPKQPKQEPPQVNTDGQTQTLSCE